MDTTHPTHPSPRARFAALIALSAAPPVVLALAGLIALGQAGLAWLVGFGVALVACWFGAWKIARKLLEVPAGEGSEPAPGTYRAALEVVEAQAARVALRPPETLAQPRAMLEDALELANAVALQLRPGASDPFARHTVPELAAAASLAFERLERRIDALVPGSHLFTVEQWRRLASAPRWVTRAGGALSAVKGALGRGRRAGPLPEDTEGRRSGLREDALATMHSAFLRELGGALIEMSAGRLRDGSAAYREGRPELEEAARPSGLPGVLRQLRHARESWVRAPR